MSILAMRALRVVVLLTLLAGALGGAGRAGAQELDGDVFTDDDYGWSVTFDGRIWSGEVVDERASQGVALSGDQAFANLVVYDDGIEDAQGCLDDLDRALTTGDTWQDLKPSRTLDAPATARAAVGGIYTGTLVLDDGDLDAALYLECREVDGATLSVSVTTVRDAYVDALPDIEDLLAGIDTGGTATQPDDETPPTTRRTPTPTADPSGADVEIPDGIEGDTYGNADAGLLVEWDDRVWTVEELDEGIGIFVSRELDNAISIGQVEVRTNLDATDVDDCAAELGDELETLDGISDVSLSRTLEAPETDRDAAGGVYEYTFTTDDGTDLPLVSYLECRALADGSALRVELTADAASYEDQVEDFAAFIAGIQVVDAGAGTDDVNTPEARRRTPTPASDDDTPEAGGTPNDVAAGELDGDTFTDDALGYAFTWDDRTWQADLLEDGATAGVFLSTDDEELFATVTVDGSLGYDGIDAEQCVSDYADSLATLDGYSTLREERTIDGLEPPRGAAGAVFSYTFTYEDGTEGDLVAYVECRPLSDEAMIRVIVQTSEASLDANADVFQELLDGIEIDAGGSADDPTTGDETPAADEQEA